MVFLHVFDSVCLSFPSVVVDAIAARMLALIIRNMIILLVKFKEVLIFEAVHTRANAAPNVTDVCRGLMYF